MFVGDKSIGAISYKPSINKLDNYKQQELIELNSFYENAKKIISGDAIEVVDEMLTLSCLRYNIRKWYVYKKYSKRDYRTNN